MVNNFKFKILGISTFVVGIFLLLGANSNALAVANHSISLNTLNGYVDGVMVYYIVTDTSDNKTAVSITESRI